MNQKTKQKHTPEPWECRKQKSGLNKKNEVCYDAQIIASKGDEIAHFFGDDNEVRMGPRNAERATECVNAFASIVDPQEFMDHIVSDTRLIDMAQKVEYLKAEIENLKEWKAEYKLRAKT